MPKPQPHFNKRKWFEKRQDKIAEQYRSGLSWREIIEQLQSSDDMPFLVDEAEFFKYCDFLLDIVGNSHREENIVLQQQLCTLKKQLEVLTSTNEALSHQNQTLQALQSPPVDEIQLDETLHELERVTSEYAQLASINNALRLENKQYIQQLHDNAEQLQDNAAKLTARNSQGFLRAKEVYEMRITKAGIIYNLQKIIIKILVSIIAVILLWLIITNLIS